jgi:hypothetical protein
MNDADGMSYSELMGPKAPGSRAPTEESFDRPRKAAEAEPAAPPGVTLEPGRAWDAVLGDIPAVWGPSEIVRQRRLAREQQEMEESARRSHDERVQREEARAAEAERTRPRTLEERVAALEAKFERLTQPTRLASRAKPRPSHTTQGGGDLPPAA